ncbi:ATP-binding protein [Streptomyces beihaiensis]|uniref:ATP-binding protein n=1 Tax=Streptomyces beihaiensis TaxID=2984495 RepID=A0ABT3TQS2_9ACTN|nr:ATP-binding protein [Streptomyces beihaiensis]MCX3059366.1 ATP-binding protein [Streptomyces beihaiensis]
MKQSAAKTLGVAALGAAFAAAGAGAANAAAPALPDTTGALDSVTSTLPAGGTQALPQAESALNNAMTTARPVVEKVAPHVLPGDQGGQGAPSGLLGGLPVNGLTGQGLPLGPGLPVGGLGG